jgi:hypothetical protein
MGTAEKLAASLFDAVREHGRPNSFSPKELYSFHGAPSPLRIGQLMRTASTQAKLRILLHSMGWRGTMPVYTDRRFHV